MSIEDAVQPGGHSLHALVAQLVWVMWCCEWGQLSEQQDDRSDAGRILTSTGNDNIYVNAALFTTAMLFCLLQHTYRHL